jgi:alkanesulfonate monooxygenase SsuD/methylene tetrahydromethanopterin reductase-like flavin-dependent oxidoreductase (luciferase family)
VTGPRAAAQVSLITIGAGHIFESLWVGDHIALPDDQDGKRPRLEVVVAISHLAAVTTRIRLGFGVIVLPQRQPVLLAKQLSSIDILSNGRLTVGVGYVEPELRVPGARKAILRPSRLRGSGGCSSPSGAARSDHLG